jgi:hypothetical protein
MRGIIEISYIELKKLHKSYIEQERIRVTDKFEARIEAVMDLKTYPTLSKNDITFWLASCTGNSTES